MLTALLVGVLATQTVTFTHPCANSAVVLEALGKQLGVRMAPGGSVTKDFFAVRFTDRPPEDVKRVIADTLNAVWLERSGVLLLDRGPAQEKKEEELELAAFRDGIERFLKANPVKPFSAEMIRQRMEDGLKIKPDPDDERRLNPELSTVMPATRFYARLVRALGTETILKVTEEKPLRLILRADGTGNMSPHVKGIVEDFVSEGNQVWDIGIQTGGTIWIGEYGPPAPVPLGYTVSIVRTKFSYDVSILRDLFQGPNNSFNQPGSKLSISKGASAASSEAKVELPAPKGKLKLSNEALSVMKVLKYRSRFPQGQAEPSAEEYALAMQLAKDLVKYEPLTLFGGAPLMAAAEQAGRDIVAIVPDYYAFAYSGWTGSEDISTIWKPWSQSLLMTEDSATKIVKVVPRIVRYTREIRLDRAAASQFIRVVDRNKRVTLDALADFVLSIDDDQEFHVHLDHVSHFLAAPWREYGQWEALKSFGGLNEDQRRQARSDGIALTWQALSPSIQSVLSRVLHSHRTTFREVEPQPPKSWSAGLYGLNFTMPTGLLVLKGAVPSSTTVRIRVQSNTLLKPGKSSQGYSSNELLSPAGFASRTADGATEYSASYTQAAVANAERVILDVHIPDVGYVSFVAQVDDTTENTKYVPLSQLPEPWKSQLAEAIKKNGGGNP